MGHLVESTGRLDDGVLRWVGPQPEAIGGWAQNLDSQDWPMPVFTEEGLVPGFTVVSLDLESALVGLETCICGDWHGTKVY